MRHLIALLFSFCLCGTALSASDPPSQALTKQAHGLHHQTTNSVEPPTDKQRGTESIPLFVKIVSPSDQKNFDDIGKNHNNESTHEWWGSPEWWLVILTGALVLATLVLAFVTYWLWSATKKLAHDAQKSSERQSSLERPWLFIEAVRVVRREGAPIQPEIPNNWYVSFMWKNIGRSPALIEDCIFKIENKDSLPEIPDYAHARKLCCPSTVAAEIEFETSQVGPSPEKGVKDGRSLNLTVYGKLTYKELNGTQHHTGFAIDVSPHLPAFSANECKSYEYYD